MKIGLNWPVPEPEARFTQEGMNANVGKQMLVHGLNGAVEGTITGIIVNDEGTAATVEIEVPDDTVPHAELSVSIREEQPMSLSAATDLARSLSPEHRANIVRAVFDDPPEEGL